MHPNDTLQGKLVDSEWEREDQKHLRGSFGYWRMVEHRMIRAEIIAEGGDPENVFEVSRRVERNHKSDLSLREQQELARAKAGPVIDKEGVLFTREELEYLVDRFGMANDPIALAIHNHAWAALVRMELRGS